MHHELKCAFKNRELRQIKKNHRPCRHLLRQAKGAEGPGRCNQVRRKTHRRRGFRSPFGRFNHKRTRAMHKAAD